MSQALDVVHHTCGLVNLVVLVDDEQQLTASQEGVGGGSLVCQDLELTSQSPFGHLQEASRELCVEGHKALRVRKHLEDNCCLRDLVDPGGSQVAPVTGAYHGRNDRILPRTERDRGGEFGGQLDSQFFPGHDQHRACVTAGWGRNP